MNEVAVALVVFDAQNETDPFSGVYHWDRALRQAQRVQVNTTWPLKKFLVAARTDRGGIGVSPERLWTLIDELGFDGYFETSAKEGWKIPQLQSAIGKAIEWDALPKVSSTALFQQIKDFLVKEKQVLDQEKQTLGRYISTIEDLYHAFLLSKNPPAETIDLPAQFETCIGRVESAGLIKRISFGRLVLLQSELLDAYASALVQAVLDEPDGLGSILEERVRTGNFRMASDERIRDKNQEGLLLLAMIEDLLRRDLALREEEYLVFPSQSTKENPNLPNPEGKTVIFDFEGPVLNVYATLAVRIANSGFFKKKELWKNAITYTNSVGSTCGMFLRNIGEGRGELTLFFDKDTSSETQISFEEFVLIHLKRRALPESIKRRRILTCDACNVTITEQMIQLRRARGFDWLDCPICGNRVSLIERDTKPGKNHLSSIQKMEQTADTQRDIEVNKTSVEGKEVIKEFDVFLCHHNVDKPFVKKIAEQLKEKGILPWLDETELRPGVMWQPAIEEQIKKIKVAAVFIGKGEHGTWQKMEMYALLRKLAKQNYPVIPVILPDVEGEPDLPSFLDGITCVDFRHSESNPLDRLIWGIKGEH